MKQILWFIEPVLGIDGKPSLRNVIAIALSIRLLMIDACAEGMSEVYVITIAGLVTTLLGLKVAQAALESRQNNQEP